MFCRLRIEVDDRDERGPWINVQAGGTMAGSSDASLSSTRNRDKASAAFDERLERVEPGRSITAIGNISAICRQRCHLSNPARLSAPITQTNCMPDFCAIIKLKVSAVKRVLWAASKAVMRIEGWAAICWHHKMRSDRGASCRWSFNGFPGVTSHQIWSSSSRFKAISETSTWPSWGGLNDPPNRPMRWPGSQYGRR